MIRKLFSNVISIVGKIKWESLTALFHDGRYYELTHNDHQKILDVLEKGNYFILTRRNCHLSTYLCSIANFFLTGHWGYWSHFCMNIELGSDDLFNKSAILESIGTGVKTSRFYEVFNCSSVCILKPILPGRTNWENLIEKSIIRNVGKAYDNFFELNNPESMSCVEIGLDAIKQVTNYEKKFHGLVAMINNEKNLTPDMFLMSGSFEVVLEIKGKW